MENQAETDGAMKVAWIIWAAHMGALVIYAVVVGVLGAKLSPTLQWSALGKVLFLLGALGALGSVFARGWLMEYFAGRVRGGTAARGAYLSFLVFSIALGELPAILAIVMTVTGGKNKMAYLLIAISALALVIGRPRAEQLEGLRKIEAGRTPEQ